MSEVEVRVERARGWWQRLRGLLGRPAPPMGCALLIAPCRAIHTIGMSHAIDVVFVDRYAHVVTTRSRLGPRRVAVCPRSVAVLEMAGGEVSRLGLANGTRLRLLEAWGQP